MKNFRDFMINGGAAKSAVEATRQASALADAHGLPRAYTMKSDASKISVAASVNVTSKKKPLLAA